MVKHDFGGRVVLITGALGGIGRATANAFARGGATLLLADLAEADEAECAHLTGLGAREAASLSCDISDEAAIAGLVKQALERFGRIDVIVNIAGAMIYRPVAEMSADDWNRMLAINLVGPALLTGAGLRHMPSGGSIVNIASIHARQTTAEVAGYAAAKAGICSVTRTAAIEGKPKGIRVNAVLPGAIDTPMLWNSPTIKSGAEKLDPSQVGRPEDIAEAVCFLASDAAAFITGEELMADGGRIASL